MLKIVYRIKRILFRGIVNHFLCGTRCFGLKRTLLRFAGVKIGNGTRIVGPFCFGNVTDIAVGENCWIGKDFQIHGDGKVIIGNNCDLAPEVCILTGSHEIGDKTRRAGQGLSYTIKIGSGCWLGARSTVVGNTEIGDGAIIGACALVNKDVPPDVISSGVPAKIIKEL